MVFCDCIGRYIWCAHSWIHDVKPLAWLVNCNDRHLITTIIIRRLYENSYSGNRLRWGLNLTQSTMIDFMKEYWTSRVNLLHSLSFLMSSFYYLMILWLPYFFGSIGYKQAGFISIAYPIAYIISGLVFQPIQNYFKRYISTIFLVCLIVSTIGTIWLTQLGDDPE